MEENKNVATPIAEDEYKMPDLEKVEVDHTKREVNVIKENLYDKLVTIYKEQRKVDLLPPNKNCKKGCYGRGYTGVDKDTKEPVACSCVLPAKFKEENKNMVRLNHKIRRRLLQENRFKIKQMIEQAAKKTESKASLSRVPNIDLSALQLNKEKLETLKQDNTIISATESPIVSSGI